jgi:hypothetical protein
MSTPKQRKVTEEFKREAVRLIETSGRTVAQVAGGDYPEFRARRGGLIVRRSSPL